MALNQNLSNTNIVSWRCGCRSDTANLPLSQRICPHCRRTMPEEIRQQVYQQVSREIRRDMFTSFRRVLNVLGYLCKKLLPFFLIALAVLALIGIGSWLWKILAFAFGAVSDFFAEIFAVPREFFQGLFQPKSHGFFSSLWDGIGNALEWIGDVLVWIKDLFAALFAGLKTVLGWAIWLGKLILGLLVILAALIGWLLSALKDLVVYIFSLFS